MDAVEKLYAEWNPIEDPECLRLNFKLQNIFEEYLKNNLEAKEVE